ncbi:MAG: T9SS type A sorting domain-containing protein [Saprospiraceae bacterium]|nr:T9SS type A sorting domain-containing protein [Saprospiraceae bacterium]
MKRYLVSLLLFSLASVGSAQESITWSDHISCIIYSHCSPCHNDNGIAPFPLLSYDDAYRFRYGIEPVIASRRMPPWPPSSDYGHLIGERTLTDEEIALFKLWIEQGAKEGNPDEAPEPPIYSSNQEIANPDFQVRLPTFEIPDLPELDLYRCFLIPTNEEADRFITDIEIIPGNRGVVHHVILFQDTSGIPEQLDAEDPALGYTCFGGVGSNSASMVTGWVPGSAAYSTPEGMGIFLPKGATLIAQIHYPEGSVGEVDSTLINMKFSEKNDLRRIENLPALNHFFGIDRPLFIPANTRQTFHEKFFPVPFKVIVSGIAPHAHLICESMKAFATTLSGDTIPLIDIPHWDFEWQGFYRFQKPVVIPAFSTLHGIATYNNTTSNQHLPGDVPVDVSVGEATTDEMMLFFMSFTLYEDGDEDRIVDTSSHTIHHNLCQVGNFVLSDRDLQEKAAVQVTPNPAQSYIIVSQQISTSVRTFLLVDLWGKKVLNQALAGPNTVIELPDDLSPGLYLYQVRQQQKGASFWQKLVITR